MNCRHLAPLFEIKSILSLNNTSLIRIYRILFRFQTKAASRV